MAKVAFFTFGILREARGHPQVQGFYDRNARTHEAAEQSEGFISRSRRDPATGQHGWGEQVAPGAFARTSMTALPERCRCGKIWNRSLPSPILACTPRP